MNSRDPLFAALVAKRERLASVVRHGFPVIDGLYFSQPSAFIGGWFLSQLSRDSGGDASIDLRPDCQKIRPLAEILDQLKNEHREGYWYRGQRTRYRSEYLGHIPAIGPMAVRVTLESIIPSAFRSITKPQPAEWQRFWVRPALDYYAGPARAILESKEPFLGKLLLDAIENMVFDAARMGTAQFANIRLSGNLSAPGATISRSLLDLISIAQHYDYGSIMVDVTKSISAALWFATRDWATGTVAGSGGSAPGVIYRFDQAGIERWIAHHIDGPGALPPPAVSLLGLFGLADISERFEFLHRPRAQHGGSLLGMENMLTHFLMKMQGAFEVFLFDHRSVTGRKTAMTKADIYPPGDEGLEIFRPDNRYPDAPLADNELRHFLQWMEVPESRIDHFIRLRNARVI